MSTGPGLIRGPWRRTTIEWCPHPLTIRVQWSKGSYEAFQVIYVYTSGFSSTYKSYNRRTIFGSSQFARSPFFSRDEWEDYGSELRVTRYVPSVDGVYYFESVCDPFSNLFYHFFEWERAYVPITTDDERDDPWGPT